MRVVVLSGVAALALACTKQAEPSPDASAADPLAGRLRHTIVYAGNLWGDLLECG